jgi:hypothetical protein
MGYQTIGLEGTITSWAGTNNATLIAAITEHTCQLNIDGGTADRTGYAASLSSMAMGPGLRSWGGTISGRFSGSGTAEVGYLGAVTYAAGNVLHVTDWKLDVKAKELDITTYNASTTAVGWKSFRPGILNWSGSYGTLVDSGVAPTLPSAPGVASTSAVFTITTGKTLTGNILPSQVGLAIPVGDLNKLSYSFVGDGAFTSAGANSLFPAAVVALPMWDETSGDGVADTALVFKSNTGTGGTFTGNAFWTGISITHKPNAYIDVSVTFRGSGAMTPS